MRIGSIAAAAALSCGAFALLGSASALAYPVTPFTINGMPSNGPVTAQFGVNVNAVQDPDGSVTLTVMSSPNNAAGNLITGVSGVMASSQPPLGFGGFNDPLPAGQTLQGNPYVPLGCDTTSSTFQCPGMSMAPGAQLQFVFTETDVNGPALGSIQSVDVQVNNGTFGACLKQDAIFDAHVADNCAPPKHTKITSAKIAGNKASFTFSAQNATGYRCELLQAATKKVMFNAPCNSGKKPYANGLPAGQYSFEVRGTNAAGYAKKPAVRVFMSH